MAKKSANQLEKEKEPYEIQFLASIIGSAFMLEEGRPSVRTSPAVVVVNGENTVTFTAATGIRYLRLMAR